MTPGADFGADLAERRKRKWSPTAARETHRSLFRSERELDIPESFTAYVHTVLFLFPHLSLYSANRRGSFLERDEIANYPMDVTILHHQSNRNDRRSRKRSWMEKHAEETRSKLFSFCLIIRDVSQPANCYRGIINYENFASSKRLENYITNRLHGKTE